MSPPTAVATESIGEQLEVLAEDVAKEVGLGGVSHGRCEKEKLQNVVFVTSEVAPWSKTGGLGDVCGSLPPTLAARGHRVMVVAPRYGDYEDAFDTEVTATLWLMDAHHTVRYFHCARDGVDWVFVDYPPAFLRAGTPYGDENGTFGDNQFRFTLLQMAALEAPLVVPVGRAVPQGVGEGATDDCSAPMGDDVMFVANDWQASLLPVLLATKYRPNGCYWQARTLLVIHNLFHQGVFPPGTFASLPLPDEWYGALEYQYPEHQRQGSFEEEGRSLNYLKAGICTADRVATVSPGYAREMTTWQGGWGLNDAIGSRWETVDGVLNGIDEAEWNPSSDPHLVMNYTRRTAEKGKAACKAAMQQEMGLPERPEAPLVVFVGRLDQQKGADLVIQAAPWMADQGAQLIMLGTGRKDLEYGLAAAEDERRDAVRGYVGFNSDLAHRMIAAADILVMPSRFEPCGLNQLFALRYGTVPVVHATGGLGDSVQHFNPFEGTGTGWTFDSCDVDAFIHALGCALDTYYQYPDSWRELVRRGMATDVSWRAAAEKYEDLFYWAKNDLPQTHG